jgi:tetratricopeptide (TPR) repeat protein
VERRIQAGARLGRFELLERLGDGAMGEVYRARDVELGRIVAVKLLRTGGGSGPAEERRRRFVREQQAAARIRHHGVVAVHDAGEVAGVSWLAMDLVEGESLEALLRRGPLEPAAALRLGVACARAVEALHAAGVLHRDLKPANILVDAAGNPRLTDFGVAALDGAEALTRTGQVVGTPLYMAPEQLAGQPVDARADVYGLGAVVYEALAGRPPWAADTFHLLISAKTSPPPAPSRARRDANRGSSTASGSGWSSGLRAGPDETQADAVVLRALAADPAERQASAAALADELELALIGGGARPARRLALAIACAVAGLGLAALVVVGGGRAGDPAVAARTETPAALRRRLEARAARAPSLGELEPELAVALQTFTTSSPEASPRDAEALVAWAGLLALVEGDVDRAAGLEARLGDGAASLAPAQALRGGLDAHRGDPAVALRELDAAGRGGLRQAELEGWRARALARRGVERAEASSQLERVAALRGAPGVTAAATGADLLEVACLIGLGRRVEALGVFDRLLAPPDELRWDLAVLAASDAVPIGRYVEALQGSAAPGREGPARVPRPARPVLRREEELSAQLLAFLRQRSAQDGTVLHDDDRQQLAAALELRRLVTPGLREPTGLALDVLVLVRKSVLGGYSQGMVELLLDVSEGWPDDADVQNEVVNDILALRFLDGGYLTPGPADVDARLEACGRRASALTRPGAAGDTTARVVHAAALLQLGRLDEVAGALEEAERAVRTLRQGDERAQSLAGTLLLLRARLAARRGEIDRALALVGEAEGKAHAQLRHWVRLDALRARPAQLLEEVLAYAAQGPFHANMAVVGHLQELLWSVLAGAGRWAEAGDYYAKLVDLPGRTPNFQEIARASHALVEQGRLEEAAVRAKGLEAKEGLPADLARRVREGDPAALAVLLAITR